MPDGYTKHRKGAAGKRLAPQSVTRSNRWLEAARRLLLVILQLNKQAANAYNYKAKL